MNRMTAIALSIGLLVLAGCGEPTIDASTEAAMNASIAKVREALPEARRAEFDDAMQVLAFRQLGSADDPATQGAAAVGAGNLEARLRHALDGKTGEQIIRAADAARAH